MGRQFLGVRDGVDACRVFVVGDRQCHRLCDPGQVVGEEQYEWGYGGAGPRNLSRAILFAVTADCEAASLLHQRFKWDVVSKLGDPYWILDFEDVEEWIMREVYRIGFADCTAGDVLELGGADNDPSAN